MNHDSTGNKPAATSDGQPGTSGHEFTDLDNQRFARLATSMQAVASLKFLCGICLLAVGLPRLLPALRNAELANAAGSFFSMLVPPVIGIWTYRAAAHLRKIVATEGNDLRHLMAAVDELSRLYILQFALWLAATGLAGWQVWKSIMHSP